MMQEEFLKIIHKEMVPALGCTDPIGVAYAAAYAKKYASDEIVLLNGELSVNIIKNAAAVCIPGTDGKCGVTLAIALGAAAGDSDKGLEVLSGIEKEDVDRALALVESNKVTTSVATNDKKLYIKINLRTQNDEVEVVIEDSYTNVVSVTKNGNPIASQDKQEFGESVESKPDYSMLSVKNILEFAREVPLEKLNLIERAVKMNMAVAKEGLAGDYGLGVGKNVKQLLDEGYISDDLVNTAMMWTTAGTDARMAGCSLPVMSNTGSGNQGITSTLPVISIAKKINASWEKTVRSALISSLVTIYIKDKLGTLSAVCGAVVASMGSSCGIVYLLDGTAEQMIFAMQNVVGNLTGMLCDGAKAGCSLKVATCTNTAVMSALMAIKNNAVKSTDGVVGDGEKETIDNFVKIAQKGMDKTDNVILDIIMDKA